MAGDPGAMTYGDLSPRNGVYHYGKMLERAVPMMFLERTAKLIQVPKNKGKQVSARRYNRLTPPSTPMTEGVIPRATHITYNDFYAALQQWGDYTPMTDVVQDTHEDPILTEFRDIHSQSMAETKENVDWETIKGGTAVAYTNGAARTAVNTPPTGADFDLIERTLLSNFAQYFTSLMKGKAADGTVPIAPSFIAVGHTDLKWDLEQMSGYVKVENYASPDMVIHPYYERGAYNNIRFLLSPLFTPYADAGGAVAGSGTTMKSTTGVSSDVYPIVIFTKLFWACTPLRGRNSGTILVVNPKATPSQPLAQLGSVGWKIWRAGMIIDDTLGYRLESAVTNTPA